MKAMRWWYINSVFFVADPHTHAQSLWRCFKFQPNPSLKRGCHRSFSPVLLLQMFLLDFYQHFMEPTNLKNTMSFQKQHHVFKLPEKSGLAHARRSFSHLLCIEIDSAVSFSAPKRLKTEELPSRTKHQHQQRHQNSTCEVANQNVSEKKTHEKVRWNQQVFKFRVESMGWQRHKRLSK